MKDACLPKTELEELIRRKIGVTINDTFTIQIYRGIIKKTHRYHKMKGIEALGDHEFDREKKTYYPTNHILSLHIQRGKMEFNDQGIYVPSLALIFYNVESYTPGKEGYSPLLTLLQHNKLWQEPVEVTQ